MSDKLTDSDAPSEHQTPSVEPHGDPLAEAALDDAPATDEGTPQAEADSSVAASEAEADAASADGGEVEAPTAPPADEAEPVAADSATESAATEEGTEAAKDSATAANASAESDHADAATGEGQAAQAAKEPVKEKEPAKENVAAAEGKGDEDSAATNRPDEPAEPKAEEAATAESKPVAAEAETAAKTTEGEAAAAAESAEAEVKAEPAAQDEKAAESGKTEPAKSEPAKTEAAKTEPAKSESGKSEPAEKAPKKEAKAATEGADKGDEAAEEEEVEDTPEVAALREAKDNKTPVTGRVIGWNRGGFHVALESFTAFCPNSEMEPGRPKDPASYLDKELTFRVIKVQKRGRRVVLSRAELAREERAAKAAETLKKLAPGAVLKGTVSSVTDFGAFVDLGGVEGLVHVSEISRSRVGHAREAVQVGKEVEVKVLKVEQGGKRISLSMKALEPNPWDGVAERFPRGGEFTGKVVRKTDFGLFVELEPDVDGLVHLSRLPHGVEMNDESIEVGKEVKGWVQEVEPKRQRISLSLREIPKNDPWQAVGEQFPEGEAVEGTVESLAPFGVFINLAPGLTGLLPASEMGLPKNANPGRIYAPGQKVKVQVVSIDRRRKRISLAKEGSAVEGSRNDYQSYVKKQKEVESTGMSAMEAAFAKLKGDR